MRSLAFTKRRSHDRGNENHVFMLAEAVAEPMGSSGYLVASADQIIEIKRIWMIAVDALEQLAAASPIQGALIEAVGLSLRGQEIADRLEVTLDDLANIRGNLKRHIQRLWHADVKGKSPAPPIRMTGPSTFSYALNRSTLQPINYRNGRGIRYVSIPTLANALQIPEPATITDAGESQ